MSSKSTKTILILATAALAFASTGAFAKDHRYDDRPGDRYDDRYDDRNDDRNDDRYDDRNDDRYGGGEYDYAKVVDVQPLSRRVRVTTPVRECWDETRYDDREYRNRTSGGTLLGAVIGAAIGNQIGHGDGRRAATAGGAVIGAAIGRNQAERRASQLPPGREYTVQRCETRYQEDVQERIDGYRVTYIYNGRRQVTQLPYKPGDRIRVRVDVSPAE
jgi:uncharacterized protein YcfJ